MKLRTTILCMMAAVAVCSTTAFRDAGPDKSLANVVQSQGVYIFNQCKPVQAYDFVGHVKIKGLVNNFQIDHMTTLLIEKARKEFKDKAIDGIIVGGTQADEGDAIKFK